MDEETKRSHIERLINSLGMAQEASDTAERIDVLNDLVRQDVSNTVLFTEMGGIKSILDAMKHHHEDAHVVQCSCNILGNVLSNNNARTAMAEQKGIQLIIGAMIRHIDDADVQAHGCNALVCVAQGNRMMIADNGGILCIVGAMKLHKKNAHVQQNAIGTIGILAADTNAGKMFVGFRGIGVIVQAMRQHLDNTDIQCKGCTTLRKLANCDIRAVVDNGGIQVMLETMRHYSEDLVVLPCAMQAVGTMVRVWRVARAFVEDGGMQILLQVMRQHLGSEDVQKFGCLTLAILADHPTFLYREDYVLEGIPAIIIGMKQHLDDAMVQAVAFLAFSSMDRDEGRNHGIHCRVIGREGGIPMVIEAMNRHLDNAFLQREGCSILASCARTDFNLKEIAMADGFSTIINAMIRHDANEDIQRSGHRALGLLVEDWSRTFCHWQSPGP